MKSILYFTVIASILTTQLVVAGAKELLFDGGKYNLTWESIPDGIRFHLNVETTGWVGLGISLTPSMENSDLFLGGITDADSTPYHGDYYGTGNRPPIPDAQDDWTVLEEASWQSDTHTVLTFSRLLVTADELGQDIDITDAHINVLWAYGETDAIAYHVGKKGSIFINLLEDACAPK